ncbi:hypothetical protein EVAR_46849_1 [Eumeta japonica]|uniref:Uncharacterized protein n=1 Tax=Eumeta variegata TaxID=151549 RepID=A0A4C1XS61_EUMVA|nr:hypothetical protein EVAR_46849_1 [Eumeta japonica]
MVVSVRCACAAGTSSASMYAMSGGGARSRERRPCAECADSRSSRSSSVDLNARTTRSCNQHKVPPAARALPRRPAAPAAPDPPLCDYGKSCSRENGGRHARTGKPNRNECANGPLLNGERMKTLENGDGARVDEEDEAGVEGSCSRGRVAYRLRAAVARARRRERRPATHGALVAAVEAKRSRDIVLVREAHGRCGGVGVRGVGTVSVRRRQRAATRRARHYTSVSRTGRAGCTRQHRSTARPSAAHSPTTSYDHQRLVAAAAFAHHAHAARSHLARTEDRQKYGRGRKQKSENCMCDECRLYVEVGAGPDSRCK